MKKIVIGIFVCALLVSSVAYAERGRDSRKEMRAEKAEKLKNATSTREMKLKNASSTKEMLKNVDASCVATAVAAREDSIMSAWVSFQADVTTLMEDRKEQLVSAWSIEDQGERRAKLKEIAKTIKSTKKETSKEYKDARKEAWEEFKSDAKACGGAEGSEASREMEAGEKFEI